MSPQEQALESLRSTISGSAVNTVSPEPNYQNNAIEALQNSLRGSYPTSVSSAAKNGWMGFGTAVGMGAVQGIGNAIAHPFELIGSASGDIVNKRYGEAAKTLAAGALSPIEDLWNFVSYAPEQALGSVASMAEKALTGRDVAFRFPNPFDFKTMIANPSQYIKEQNATGFVSPTIPNSIKSIADQQKQLSNQFGTGVGTSVPYMMLALNAVATVPDGAQLLGRAVKSSIKGLGIQATEQSGMEMALGRDVANSIPENERNIFNYTSKMQAAEQALKMENPSAIDVPAIADKYMKEAGASPTDASAQLLATEKAQQLALSAVEKRAKTITATQHAQTIQNILKFNGETAQEAGQFIPNYIKKYAQFEQIIPDLSRNTGIPAWQMTLGRADRGTQSDITNAINLAKDTSIPYNDLLKTIYDKHPWLQYYRNFLEPDAMAFSSRVEHEGLGVLPIESRNDLINRLQMIKNEGKVPYEIPTPQQLSPSTTEALAAIAKEDPRGYKVVYSPHDYKLMIPKKSMPTPKQNVLGMLSDVFGLRSVDQQRIGMVFEDNFGRNFQKEFPSGMLVTEKDGTPTIYNTDTFTQPQYSKSGVMQVPVRGDNILDRLFQISRDKNRYGIGGLSLRDLTTQFGKENGTKLWRVMAKSRILPRDIEGIVAQNINKLRTVPAFDKFMGAMVNFRYNQSPGFGIRAYLKNQLRGLLNPVGKPINVAGIASWGFTQDVINKFPFLAKVIGGVAPSSTDVLDAIGKVVGNSRIFNDPASEAYVFDKLSENAGRQGLQEALKSTNWFQNLIGYSQAQDIVDLARSFMRRTDPTLKAHEYDKIDAAIVKMVKDGNPDMLKMKEQIDNAFHYPNKGIISSPMMNDLNNIFFPLKFEANIMRMTAEWWWRAPNTVKSATLQMFNQAVANSQSPKIQAYAKKHANEIKAFSYVVPYMGMMNFAGQVVNAVQNPQNRAIQFYNAFQNEFQMGGLALGLMNSMLQSQGIIPQSPYTNAVNKTYPMYVPEGLAARGETAVQSILGFMMGGSYSLITGIPGGIGSSISAELPPTYKLKANERQPLQPGQSLITTGNIRL